MAMKASVVTLAVGLSLVAAGNVAAVEYEWFANGEATAFSDDNSSRAAFSRDIVDDVGGLLAVSGVLRAELDTMSAASVEGFAESELHDLVTPLDRITAGLKGSYQWQTRLGYTAPLYSLSLSVQDDNYDADPRDSSVYVAQFFATRRLTDQVSATAGIEGTLRDAEGTVFDLGQGRAFLSADWAFAEPWALYGTLGYTRGDTFSSAQQVFCNGATAVDTYPLVAISDRIEPDTAFNDALCGSWLVYQAEAVTQTFTLGINRAVGHSTSVDLSALLADVEEVQSGLGYERTLLRAGILARF